jgi:myosin heavy subunit
MQVEHAAAYAKESLVAMSRGDVNRIDLVEMAIGKLEEVGIMQGGLHSECMRKVSELRTKIMGLREVADCALKSADEARLEEVLRMADELNLPEFPRLDECAALLRRMREQNAVQRFEEALESRSVHREKLLEKSALIARELNLDTELARRVFATLEALSAQKQEMIRTMFQAVRDKQKEQLAQALKRARDLGMEIPRGTRQKLADEGMSRGMSIQQLLGI